MQHLLRNPVMSERERLEALYAGRVLRFGANAASLALVDRVWRTLVAHFGPRPREAQFALSGAAWFEALTRCRRALLADDGLLAPARDLFASLASDLDQTWFDRLRLRGVPSGGHRDPLAANAFKLHRDIWYANPAAQVNWWIALDDVNEAESFALWPAQFRRPIRNDSRGFDYARWNELGGWQVAHEGKHYPTALEPPVGESLRVACGRGEFLLFSGCHFHGPMGHDSGRTRFSCEMRVVHSPDVERCARELAVDNESCGSTLPDYLSAKDFRPWGAPT